MNKVRLLMVTSVLILLAAASQAQQNQPESIVQIFWLNNYNQALMQSKASNKMIFIDCYADWCTWCHKMEKEIYSDSTFVQFLQGYVPLRIDIEDRKEGTQLAARYDVQSLPTVLVVDSSGRIINRIGGYLETQDLINDLTMMKNLIDRERSNPNDWHAVQDLAEEYLFRDMNAEAELRFTRLLQSPVGDYTKESAHFSLALAQYYQHKNVQALTTLQKYLETYVDGKSIEEVFLLRSQIYLEMDEPDKAKEILEQFLKKFPESRSAGRAREVLSKLN